MRNADFSGQFDAINKAQAVIGVHQERQGAAGQRKRFWMCLDMF